MLTLRAFNPRASRCALGFAFPVTSRTVYTDIFSGRWVQAMDGTFSFDKKPPSSLRTSDPHTASQPPKPLICPLFIEREMSSSRQWQKATLLVIQDTVFEKLQGYIEAIAYMGIPGRKELLKIARCQRSLTSNSLLRRKSLGSRDSYVCSQDKVLPKNQDIYLLTHHRFS